VQNCENKAMEITLKINQRPINESWHFLTLFNENWSFSSML
jgi:hypothetical protein